MDRLLKMADPEATGSVAFKLLRELPCWRTEEQARHLAASPTSPILG